MSLLSRIANVFRRDRLNSELDEEMQSHIDEAIEQGRDPSDARRAFGSPLRQRESSRDVRLAVWLDSLRADMIFGWRQLAKNKAVSGAAILSLALSIGACTAAFRLIDAILLRPLPVSEPERLHFLALQFRDQSGNVRTGDIFQYPLFRKMRAAAKDKAELMAISGATRIDLTYASDQEMEKAYRQYVSGWMFGVFGLKAAQGRLLTSDDDVKPDAHPYAVLSYDYWTRRFGQDPKIVGRTFRIGDRVYEVIGVVEEGFTGTEPGTLTDIFLPTMMNGRAINNAGWGWFRTWVQVKQGTEMEQLRQKMHSEVVAFRIERAKTFGTAMSKERIEEYIRSPLIMEPASAGVSGLQKEYTRSLLVLGVLVCLVLLIACANVANLMTAQAAARAREMALRVSIGAGRLRLVQLVLMESALIALIATALGGMFAWWSAPFVVGMISPADNPARLVLPGDWRVFGFAGALALVVTILFGLAPALRASSVKPASALKGGADPHARRRLMHVLIAAQVAFCFLVHFVAGLFVATFDRVSSQPTGFAAERLLALESVGKGDQPPAYWDQVLQHLRSVQGVESAGISGWALMSGNGWSSGIHVGGKPLNDSEEPYFLNVSPGWLGAMRIPLIEGRDFRPEETQPDVAIVNEAFAKRYFDGANPVGKSFDRDEGKGKSRMTIVGYARNARYLNMREQMRPTAYVPYFSKDDKGVMKMKDWGTFMVRTSEPDAMRMAALLRNEVQKARPEFRVTTVISQEELVQKHTVQERLLAMLSLFFAAVALALAAVGLYGVLSYSVLQRRREIGIRMALGANPGDVARRVVTEIFGMLLIGAASGMTMGIVSEKYFERLLFGVHGTDFGMLALPLLTISVAAVLSALPAVIRAVRIDPSLALRAE